MTSNTTISRFVQLKARRRLSDLVRYRLGEAPRDEVTEKVLAVPKWIAFSRGDSEPGGNEKLTALLMGETVSHEWHLT